MNLGVVNCKHSKVCYNYRMTKRRKKGLTRNATFAFRTTKEVLNEVEKISRERSRTKGLQCEAFIKDGIAKYYASKDSQPIQQADSSTSN